MDLRLREIFYQYVKLLVSVVFVIESIHIICETIEIQKIYLHIQNCTGTPSTTTKTATTKTTTPLTPKVGGKGTKLLISNLFFYRSIFFLTFLLLY